MEQRQELERLVARLRDDIKDFEERFRGAQDAASTCTRTLQKEVHGVKRNLTQVRGYTNFLNHQSEYPALPFAGKLVKGARPFFWYKSAIIRCGGVG